MFFVILKNGININDFKHQNLSVDKLYIKFDKKLIINAKNIQIPKKSTKSKANFTASDLNDIFSYIPLLDKYFEEVNLENIIIGEDNITALFKENIFYINTPYLKIDTELIPNENGYNVAIYEFLLSGFDLMIAGDGHINLTDRLYEFDGFFQTHEINGKLDFTIQKGLLKYYIKSASAKSLENFMDELGFKTAMDQEVKEWIYGKVVAGFYDVEFLSGEIDLINLDYHPTKMKAFGTAYDLNVAFSETLAPANANLANVTLNDGNLYFDLINPSYEGKDLNGSKVTLVDFMEGKTKIFVNIKTDSLLDETILNILKNYDINVPVLQKSGNLKSDTNLKITINPIIIDVNVTANLQNANLEMGGAKFYSKKANIFIDNNSVNISDGSLKMDSIFDASNIEGKLNLKEENGKFKTKFNSVKIDKIFHRTNFKSDINLNFKKDVNLDIKALNLKLNLNKNLNTIQIESLQNNIPYSSILSDLQVQDANVKITSKDFKNFDILAKDVIMQTPFIKKNGNKYSKDDINMKFYKGILNGITKSNLVNFSVKDNSIFVDLKDLDFVLETDKKDESMDFPNVIFEGKNSNLILQNFDKIVELNSYHGSLNKKNIKFEGISKDGGDVSLYLRPEIVSISATNISGETINNFIKNDSFSGGNFSLKMVGDSLDKFQVEILANDTHLTDFVFYQKLLSFIDSVPSLLKLKTPDFNSDGFSVKDGKLYFSKNGDKIHIQGMNFKGTSADIAGTGEINTKTGEINVDLEIIYLKDASSIIDAIPIVNQIFLGRDRVFSTIIEVRGTFKNPKYTNKAVSDVLLSPFNIIRNVLELPVSIFD